MTVVWAVLNQQETTLRRLIDHGLELNDPDLIGSSISREGSAIVYKFEEDIHLQSFETASFESP